MMSRGKSVYKQLGKNSTFTLKYAEYNQNVYINIYLNQYGTEMEKLQDDTKSSETQKRRAWAFNLHLRNWPTWF